MTTFERRQRLLSLLREQPGIRTTEMARLLAVSKGTIRNDLCALEEEGALNRVRGGGVLRLESAAGSSAFSRRALANQTAKQHIARWAADLVEDGDTIVLDASSTVYFMAPHLNERRRLTVFTNGIETARYLARNPNNSVILIGGAMRSEGTGVTGLFSERLLATVHVKTAFVSATGVDLDAGLTERDLPEAQIKDRMIAAADQVVGLIDSAKFGRIELTPFARLNQLQRLFTDSGLHPAWIAWMQNTCVSLTICDADTTTTYTPCGDSPRHYRIGFANLGEQIPFAVDVRRGLERAAREAGDIDLVLADNQLDGYMALQVADYLIGAGVDLVIEYQIEASIGDAIMAKYRQAGIPVIAVDIPMTAATFFGVDNYTAGKLAGGALGAWVKAHWGGKFDHIVVLESARQGVLTASRVRGQIDGLAGALGEIDPGLLLKVEGGVTAEACAVEFAAVLAALEKATRIVVVPFNDDAAIGAITAARRMGRTSHLVVAGQGADRRAREELLRPDTPLIGSTAYMPEHYGERLLALARSILRQEPVPPAVYMEHVFLTRSNLAELYPEEERMSYAGQR